MRTTEHERRNAEAWSQAVAGGTVCRGTWQAEEGELEKGHFCSYAEARRDWERNKNMRTRGRP